MPKPDAARLLGSAAALIAWSISLTAPAAQPRTPPGRMPLDGAATPDACAALGFQTGPQYEERMPSMMAAPSPRTSAIQPRPPSNAPTIPPLPVPPVQKRIEEPRASADAGRIASPAPYQQAPSERPDTERYPHVALNGVRQTAQEPVSTFSIDVDTASYANVRRFLQDGERPPADAVRVEEMINYFDYGYARPASRATPFATHVAVVPSPWAAERQIIHIGLQGYDLPRTAPPPLNLVFLVDTSGSMWSADKLPLAQKALNLLIDQLGPQDRVSIVAYAGSAGAVLSPTDGRQKLRMRCAVDALRAGGSTAGGQGLTLAYALARETFQPRAVNRVILMTDGDFNVGVTDPARLTDLVSEQRKSGVYLSVYGFGRGNYNDTTMQALAQNGNGTAGYIDSLSEGRKLFRDDFAKSLFPIADDVKIQVEFNPARVSEYRLIGYETRLLRREDFNNDQVDAGEVGAGASVTALYEITPVGAAGSVDPLRYGRRQAAPPAGGELAFLKIRYKLLGKGRSRLIERPITRADAAPSLAAAPEATRWAVAVAGFGQRLRRDPWVGDRFGWGDVQALAQGARGTDPTGERAEFVQLARAAADGDRTGR